MSGLLRAFWALRTPDIPAAPDAWGCGLSGFRMFQMFRMFRISPGAENPGTIADRRRIAEQKQRRRVICKEVFNYG